MQLEIVPADPKQEPILVNLLELYVHDFSEFIELDIGENGRFGYPALPLYWSEPGRHPFLIRLDGKWAGLALVVQHEGVYDMAEFFILRGCRGRGIGTQVAHAIWSRFPGPWQVRVMQSNPAAVHFWTAAISKFAGEAKPVLLEKNGRLWNLFTFQAVLT